MDAIALNMRLTDDAGSEGFDSRSSEMSPPPLTATSVMSTTNFCQFCIRFFVRW